MAEKQKGTGATTITKVEAVRRALQELGTTVTGSQLQTFVRDRFGLEMTIDHIYTAKADVLRRMAKEQKADEAAMESFPQPQVEPSAAQATRTSDPDANPRAAIGKIEAVRRAVEELGP